MNSCSLSGNGLAIRRIRPLCHPRNLFAHFVRKRLIKKLGGSATLATAHRRCERPSLRDGLDFSLLNCSAIDLLASLVTLLLVTLLPATLLPATLLLDFGFSKADNLFLNIFREGSIKKVLSFLGLSVDCMFEKQTLGIKSLQISILEGFFAVVLLSAGISFIVPFAVFLGATPLEIGFLAAFPALFGSWSQLLAVKFLEKFKSRKWPIVIFIAIQALLFVPIAFIPFIFKEAQVSWLILFYTISIIFGYLGGPLWQSLMRSLTPPEIIGRYFGFRNYVVGISAFIFLIIFGFSLRLFSENLAFVFLGIFLLSAFGRLMSALLFTQTDEPDSPKRNQSEGSFTSFLFELLHTNFGKFVLFGALMSFGVALTGPFVSLHLLENIGLKNDYIMYTLIISAGMISTFISMPYWGKLIDRYGIVKVIKASSLMVAFFPLAYVFVRFPEGLILVQFLDGLIFAGFNLALASFIFGISNQDNIVRYASYQTVFFGTAIFFGAMFSGFIQSLGISFFWLSTSFYVVCVISFAYRFFIYKLFVGEISEFKQVEDIESRKIVFSILTFAPVTKTMGEMFIPFEGRIKKVGISFGERLKHVGSLVENGSEKLGLVVEEKFFDGLSAFEDAVKKNKLRK